MRDIELWTRDGHFVAVVEILPFPDDKLPEVILWGARFFLKHDIGVGVVVPQAGPSPPPRYDECFCHVSLTPSPGKERGVVLESSPTPEQARAWLEEDGPPFEDGTQAEPHRGAQVRWGLCAVGAEEDGFRGSFFTREEAITEGRLHHGIDDFLIGMGYSPDPATYMPPVEDLLERAAESASDEAGESAEDWPDVTKEAEKELSDFLASWARRHAPCPFWVLDHFERVVAKPTGMTEPPPHTD
jgi:hypothetical protein